MRGSLPRAFEGKSIDFLVEYVQRSLEGALEGALLWRHFREPIMTVAHLLGNEIALPRVTWVKDGIRFVPSVANETEEMLRKPVHIFSTLQVDPQPGIYTCLAGESSASIIVASKSDTGHPITLVVVVAASTSILLLLLFLLISYLWKRSQAKRKEEDRGLTTSLVGKLFTSCFAVRREIMTKANLNSYILALYSRSSSSLQTIFIMIMTSFQLVPGGRTNTNENTN